MYSALSLLQVDRVGGQIPVRDGVAVMMEIESFLTNRSGNHYERPEWRIERRAHPLLARSSPSAIGNGHRFFIRAVITKTHGKANAHPFCIEFYFPGVARCRDVIDTKGSGAYCEGSDELVANLPR